MKKLVFVALMSVGLMQTTGCIISSGDDDDVGSGTFLVSWDMVTQLDGGNAVDCATAGVQDIKFISEPAGGAQIIDIFDCIDLNHETAPLVPGSYDIWVRAEDAGGNLMAQSFTQTESVIDDPNPVGVDFTFPTDIGYLGLTWTVDGSASGCLTGDGVSVLSTPVGGGMSGLDEIFACEDGAGTSGLPDAFGGDSTILLPVDSYTVVVSLIDSGDQLIDDFPSIDTEIQYGNHLVDLGAFDFQTN